MVEVYPKVSLDAFIFNYRHSQKISINLKETEIIINVNDAVPITHEQVV